jgi:hypothetical protein
MKNGTRITIVIGVAIALAMVSTLGYADGAPTVLDTIVKPIAIKATGSSPATAANWIQGFIAVVLTFFGGIIAKYGPRIVAAFEKIGHYAELIAKGSNLVEKDAIEVEALSKVICDSLADGSLTKEEVEAINLKLKSSKAATDALIEFFKSLKV